MSNFKDQLELNLDSVFSERNELITSISKLLKGIGFVKKEKDYIMYFERHGFLIKITFGIRIIIEYFYRNPKPLFIENISYTDSTPGSIYAEIQNRIVKTFEKLTLECWRVV